MSTQVLWWSVETTLVAGLLALFAACCGRFRRLDASTRHLLWLVVLMKLVLPPVFQSPWAITRPELLAGPAEPREPEAVAEAPGLSDDGAPSEAIAEMVPAEHAPNESLPVLLASLEVPPEPGPESADAMDAEAPVVQEDVMHRPASAEPVLPMDDSPAGRAGRFLRTLSLPGWLLLGWGLTGLALAALQTVGILRFQHRIRQGVPAPLWLTVEAGRIADRLGVSAPEILVLPGLGSPLIWCLSRPRLLLPGDMVKSMDAASWRGILAHELAHLHRGDHWVSRLELVASFLWWWNPVFWLARRRLDAEAELACDAWVVRILPDDRLTYAEVLFQVCSKFSLSRSPTPALGVAGSGRFLERRFHMILDEQAPRPRSFPWIVAICLLALVALPSWTRSSSAAPILMVEPTADGPPADVLAPDSDGDDDADDADDDDDVLKGKGRDKQDSKSADRKAEEDEDDADDADDDADADDKDDDDDEDDAKDKSEDIEKSIESALGPDFEKKVEAMAERFAKQIEEKFGDNSEFVKSMEAFGKEMEKKFGDGSEFAKSMEAFGKEMEKKFGDDSEFAKKMEALGEEMEKKFGDGSEFAKKMEALGEEMEKKFGDNSEFAKKMEALGKEMEKKFGPDSDFAKKMEKKFGEDSEFARKMKEAAKKAEEKAKEAKVLEEKARKDDSRSKDLLKEKKAEARKDRIRALESSIQKLMKELQELKSSDDDQIRKS